MNCQWISDLDQIKRKTIINTIYGLVLAKMKIYSSFDLGYSKAFNEMVRQ